MRKKAILSLGIIAILLIPLLVRERLKRSQDAPALSSTLSAMSVDADSRSSTRFTARQTRSRNDSTKRMHWRNSYIDDLPSVDLRFSQWTETDLADRLEELLKKKSLDFTETRETSQLLLALSHLNPTAAFAILADNADKSFLFGVKEQIFVDCLNKDGIEWITRAVRDNPELRGRSGGMLKASVMKLIAASWNDLTAEDKEYTKQYIETSDPAIVSAFFAGHDSSANERMLLLDSIHLPPDLRYHAIGAIATSLSESDPESAWKLLQQHQADRSDGAFTYILSNYLKLRPDEAGGVISTLPTSSLTSLLRDQGILSAIDDGDVIIAGLKRVALVSGTMDVYKSSFTRLVQIDPNLAIEELKVLDASPARSDLARQVMTDIAKNTPEEAIQHAQSLNEPDRTAGLKGAFAELARQDFKKALNITTSSVHTSNPGLSMEVAKVALQHAPQVALDMISDERVMNIWPKDYRANLVSSAVRNIATSDIDHAVKWVERYSGDERSSAVESLVRAWMRTDPASASEWLSELPPGKDRDAGASVIVDEISRTDPEMADRWRDSLSN